MSRSDITPLEVDLSGCNARCQVSKQEAHDWLGPSGPHVAAAKFNLLDYLHKMSRALLLHSLPTTQGSHQRHACTSRPPHIPSLSMPCGCHFILMQSLVTNAARQRGGMLATAAIGFDLGNRADHGGPGFVEDWERAEISVMKSESVTL